MYQRLATRAKSGTGTKPVPYEKRKIFNFKWLPGDVAAWASAAASENISLALWLHQAAELKLGVTRNVERRVRKAVRKAFGHKRRVRK